MPVKKLSDGEVLEILRFASEGFTWGNGGYVQPNGVRYGEWPKGWVRRDVAAAYGVSKSYLEALARLDAPRANLLVDKVFRG